MRTDKVIDQVVRQEEAKQGEEEAAAGTGEHLCNLSAFNRRPSSQ